MREHTPATSLVHPKIPACEVGDGAVRMLEDIGGRMKEQEEEKEYRRGWDSGVDPNIRVRSYNRAVRINGLTY